MKQISLITLILLLGFGGLVQAESEADIKAVTEDGKQVSVKK